MFTVFEIAPERNGCTAPIIRTWPVVVDRVVTHRAGEHRHVLRRGVRRAEDRLVDVDVVDDLADLMVVVAEPAKRPRDRLVDDRHRAAPDQLLDLYEAQVSFNTVVDITVHHQAYSSGRR